MLRYIVEQKGLKNFRNLVLYQLLRFIGEHKNANTAMLRKREIELAMYILSNYVIVLAGRANTAEI